MKWDVYAWEGFGPVSSFKLFSRLNVISYIYHHVPAQWLAHTDIPNSCLRGAGNWLFFFFFSLLQRAIKDGGCYQHEDCRRGMFLFHKSPVVTCSCIRQIYSPTWLAQPLEENPSPNLSGVAGQLLPPCC